MKGHPDYWCDRIGKALDICQDIGSERMKILFDLYHVQIMDGDLINHYRQCREYVGHIHTAGNPGRCEIGSNQEINYAPLMRKLIDIGYTGYVGHEFIPTRDPMEGLREAVGICAVT